MLLALAALVPVSIALTTELAFTCAGRKGLFTRPGALGQAARRGYRQMDRWISVPVAFGAAASVGLALVAGVATRGGCLGLAAALALATHQLLYRRLGRHIRKDTCCLDVAKVSPQELARIQSRWEMAMTTRACLLASALVCVVASLLEG